jgi:hypothetical protein
LLLLDRVNLEDALPQGQDEWVSTLISALASTQLARPSLGRTSRHAAAAGRMTLDDRRPFARREPDSAIVRDAPHTRNQSSQTNVQNTLIAADAIANPDARYARRRTR